MIHKKKAKEGKQSEVEDKHRRVKDELKEGRRKRNKGRKELQLRTCWKLQCKNLDKSKTRSRKNIEKKGNSSKQVKDCGKVKMGLVSLMMTERRSKPSGTNSCSLTSARVTSIRRPEDECLRS